MVLNYKKVGYTTMWIEYPEVAPTFKNVGIEPNKEGMAYTSPTLRFPSYQGSGPQWVMESRKIAAALEERYPDPPLHLDSPILPKVEAIIPKLTSPLAPINMPRVPRDILNPRSQEYFERTRAERFGMPLSEFEKSDKGGEVAWEGAAPHFKELADLLKENGGPYFMGSIPSYADFVVVSYFQFERRLGEEDIFGRIMKMDPSFPALYEACEEWLQRDSY